MLLRSLLRMPLGLKAADAKHGCRQLILQLLLMLLQLIGLLPLPLPLILLRICR